MGCNCHLRDKHRNCEQQFSDLPTGIVLFGNERFFTNYPNIRPAANASLSDNWFCNVPEMIRIHQAVKGVREQGTETCPFTNRFESITRSGEGGVRSLLRGWHGEPVVIESSTNLVQWVPVHTNTPSLPLLEYQAPNDNGAQQRFYRAVRE